MSGLGGAAVWLVMTVLGSYSELWPTRVVYGAMLGLAQWFVLRHRFRAAGWWIAATAAGVVVDSSLFGGSLATGLVVGSAQWLYLRRQLSRAGWWLPASVLGFALGVFPVVLILGSVGSIYATASVLVLVIFTSQATIAGAVTGVALVRLRRK